MRTCFDYDVVTGALVSQTELCGTAEPLVTTLHYNDQGLVDWRRDPAQQPAGATWVFEYYGTGQAKKTTKPDGTFVSYTYDPVTGGSTTTDELGNVTSTSIAFGVMTGCGVAGSPCRVETTTAPGDGVTAQVSQQVFDRSGDLRESRTSTDGGVAWNATTYVYGALGRLLSSTDPTGVVTSYAYDVNGNVTHAARGANATDPDEAAETVYDRAGRVVGQIQAPDDAGRVTTRTDYDRVGRTVLTVTAEGTAVEQRTRTEYRANGQVKLTATDRPDLGLGVEATTENFYTAGGRLECTKTLVDHTGAGTYAYSATDFEAGTLRPEHTRTNRSAVSGCTDSAADTAKWSISATGYDEFGRTAWSQSPTQFAAAPLPGTTGHELYRTSLSYDVLGRVVGATSPDPANPGVATVSTATCFTARGETARTMDAAGNVTGFEYWPSGQVKSVTDPRGMPNSPMDLCDAEPVDATTGTVGTTYDGAGNRLTRTSYDNVGDPVVESWAYDPAGREVSHTDPLGRVTSKEYTVTSGILNATTVWSGSTTDPADPSGSSRRSTTTTAYASGRPATTNSVVQDTLGAQASRYQATTTYDAAGQRIRVGGDSFDAADALVGTQQVLFDHDRGGNITSVTYPNGLANTYTWDIAGRQTQANLFNNAGYRYTYGPDTHVDDIDLFADGVWSPLANYTYDADGKKTDETILGGDGGERSWDYDPATGLLDTFDQEILDPAGLGTALTSHWETTWNPTGRLATDCLNTTAVPCDNTDRTVAYDYDPAGQLTNAAVTNPDPDDPNSWAYSYGNRGERLTQTITDGVDVVTTTYAYDDALQLATANPDNTDPTTTYTYDQAGRRLNEADGTTTRTFGYDARGLATTVSGSAFVFTYDPLGYLGGESFFDYSERDPYPQLSMIGNEIFTVRFDRGAGLISTGQNDQGHNLRLYGTDPSGSLTEQVNSLSSSRSNYDPYGNPLGTPTLNWYRGEFSPGTGTPTFLRARWYDPITGTFTTTDPLDGFNGTPTTTNPYHYTDNDPTNKIDPLGLRPTDDDGFGAGDSRPPDPLACAGGTNAPDLIGANPHPSGGATAQLYKFPVPVKYCKGVVRINGFIGQGEVQFGFGKVDKFMGDNRGFDSRSTAQQSRASIELDFQRGQGRLFVNYTCHTDGRCSSADPIGLGAIDITTSRNWSGFNEFQHTLNHDELELRFNWPNSAVKMFGVGPCAITGKMTINFGGDGDGVEVDNPVLRDFPSFEVYHYSGSRETVLLQQKEHDLPDLCASR